MGLIEEIRELKQEVAKATEDKPDKKQKSFKIPFFKRVRGGASRNNYITVIKVNENGHAEFIKEQIKEQTVMIDNVPRLASAEYIVHVKKNPIMVIPSWSVQPISWKANFKSSLLDGSNTAGYQLLANRMELNQADVTKKGKMKGWVGWVFGIVILGIIGYAFFSGGI